MRYRITIEIETGDILTPNAVADLATAASSARLALSKVTQHIYQHLSQAMGQGRSEGKYPGARITVTEI